MCTIIFILVCPLLGYILYCTHQRPHPFLISVWSIARCCDAVWGKPCQSRGNSDISVARDYSADLIVVIRIQAPAPPPEMTSPCSFFSRILEVVQNLFLLLTFSLPLNLRRTHLRPQLQTYCHSIFFSPTTPTSVVAFKFSLSPSTCLLNPGSLPFCCQCQPEIMYHKICNCCGGFLRFICLCL